MRGQVTIFAIIGIAVIIVFVFSINAVGDFRNLFSRAQNEKFISHDYTEGILRNTVNSCLDYLAGETLKQQCLHAGYLSAVPNATYGEEGAPKWAPYNGDMVPVLLDGNKVISLAGDELGLRACRKTVIDLKGCVEAAHYEDDGYDLRIPDFGGDFSKIDAACQPFLKNGSTLIKLDYPIRLSQGQLSVEVSDFVVEKPYKLGPMYSSARAFAERIRSRSNLDVYNLSIGCAQGYTTILNDPAGVFSLIDNSGQEQDIFRFAVSGYSFEGHC